VNFSQSHTATHILKVNCLEMAGDRLHTSVKQVYLSKK